MISGKSVVAIVTARGGSKGVPGKNLRHVAGRSLIAWTMEQVRASKLLDRTILSTDDESIAAAAKSAGCEVPFMRPAELATDEATSLDVLRHAMHQIGNYDYVVLLQPTSPLRTGADIDGAIELCATSGAPSCVSVCVSSKSPNWMYTLRPDLRIAPVLPESRATRRQDLPPVYLLNGAVYVARWEHLNQGRSFVEDGAVAYQMPPDRSLDIDSELDLRLANALMQ
jgi:N-acylneuraminate cytidylyltransferase